ncbi:MAG: tRNA uridine-5-carboxymethylaminomethyl(34) synthesis GTPase MnmE [Alphaproteobacteria bacterium]|nr:tRNA uridine-5-carboxymethylaminomethyl(34) synthesis GTPase MnmE [Alphaproteobacteria bacterium]
MFAISSGPGRAGVAVVRVSGAKSGAAIAALTAGAPPPPRTAMLRRIVDPLTGEAIDRGLVLWFPAPHSFTGEDVAEFQVHGGRAVLAALFSCLGAIGCRPAEAGEFTLRAFRAGRIDLAEAEGLADLLAAETPMQRRLALKAMDGEMSARIEAWRQGLIRILAHVEAVIDFPDEDLPGGLNALSRESLRQLSEDIARALERSAGAAVMREGFTVALIGAANVGKSSLLNKLTGSEVAIVSPIAGTTRDVLTVRLDLEGYLIELADMAGLREAGDAIEAEGVRRAKGRAELADLRLLIVEPANPSPPAEAKSLLKPQDLLVLNKADLLGAEDARAMAKALGPGAILASAKSDDGHAALLHALAAKVKALAGSVSDVSFARARQVQALQETQGALGRALSAGEGQDELLAEDLRLAARALGRISGRVDVEDLLDVIFSEFCIGK